MAFICPSLVNGVNFPEIQFKNTYSYCDDSSAPAAPADDDDGFI